MVRSKCIRRLDFQVGVYLSVDVFGCHMADIPRPQRRQAVMTPAVLELQKHRVDFKLHQYDNAVHRGYAAEAAEALGIAPERVFKTLITQDQSGQFYVAIVPTSSSLNIKKLAQATGQKKMQMADQTRAERTTGYVKGGISPFGQKNRLPTFVHRSLNEFATVHVSGGRRGLEIELAPSSLIRICAATETDLC